MKGRKEIIISARLRGMQNIDEPIILSLDRRCTKAQKRNIRTLGAANEKLLSTENRTALLHPTSPLIDRPLQPWSLLIFFYQSSLLHPHKYREHQCPR